MKIKFLSVIAISLLVSLAVTSCLSTDNEAVEYSSDDTVHAFALNTIGGVNYAFTIDQTNKIIYNVDSLPFRADTIIDKTLIKTLTYMGTVSIGDSTFNYTTDSIDLSKTMKTPLKLKVWAPDGTHTKEYSIEVRVHQQDPDSLVWNKMSDSFSAGTVTGKQKSIILNNTLFVYASYNTAYTTLISDGHAWSKIAVTGLPDNANISSMLNYSNKLYIATATGEVFYSEDGNAWQKQEALSGNVATLITNFSGAISGIIQDGATLKFCVSNKAMTGWEIGNEVPSDFPQENISSTIYTTNTGLEQSFLMGKKTGATQTTPWFSLDGKSWEEASTTSDYYCPPMSNPSIIHYNDKFYAFGGDFSSFYLSKEGLVWNKIKKKVLFPTAFSGREHYSMVVDQNNFIWIIWSKGQKQDEVWRGRINRLGFKIK